MVQIKVYKDGFTALGHAEFDAHGQDIVCAAISALVQSAILGLQEYCHIRKIVEPGMVYVYLTHPGKKSALIIGTMILGLQRIERRYPAYLQVTEEWKEWMKQHKAV